MDRTTGVVALLGAALIATVSADPVCAQGSARSLDIDPSVRAAGMGGASNAVFWDGGNQWANPALLGMHHGLRYEWGDSKLVPELASDIHFETNVVKLGGSGLGVALSGKPGIGGLKLDYGDSEGTDASGNPIGPFASFEQIDSWGFGASLGQLTEGIGKLFGHELPPLSRYGDVSLGMYSKDVEIHWAPDTLVHSSNPSLDRGLLLRVSPLEWLAVSRDGLVDLDLAYGWSELSYNEDVTFPGLANTPPTHHQRRGFAWRVGLDWPTTSLRQSAEGHPWWIEGLYPMLAVAGASDHEENGGFGIPYETDGHGYEVGFANLFTYRSGEYEDRIGGIDGSTSGWSVGLPIGRLGGVRYDEARFPQGGGLGKLERKAFNVWVDPLEIWSLTHR